VIPNAWLEALLGGALIGLSVSIMLLWNGRVTGISGIINGTLTPIKGDFGWRLSFLFGLLVGGVVVMLAKPEAFMGHVDTPIWTVAAAGLLVGFGTVMGSGCTSGHGVCGISRLSMRSILATLAFMGAGILMVTVMRATGVLP